MRTRDSRGRCICGGNSSESRSGKGGKKTQDLLLGLRAEVTGLDTLMEGDLLPGGNVGAAKTPPPVLMVRPRSGGGVGAADKTLVLAGGRGGAAGADGPDVVRGRGGGAGAGVCRGGGGGAARVVEAEALLGLPKRSLIDLA